MSIDMIDIEAIDCKVCLDLDAFLSYASQVLRRGGIDNPIVVRDGIVEDKELCETLKRLGVKRIPVSRNRSRIFVSLEAMGFYDDIELNSYRVFNSTLELLYRNWPTPLVKLKTLSSRGMRVWAKLEGFNPFSGSTKDRVAWYMLKRYMEKLGKLDKVFEATSSNTGIALAALGAIYEIKVRIYVPSTISKAAETLLKVFGAEVVRTSKNLTVEILEEVKRDALAEGAIHTDQFENDANFEVHLRYTAKELDLQLRKLNIVPTAIFGAIGTSGHLSAISFYFKNRYGGDVKVYAVQPAKGERIPGIRRVETGMKWLHKVEIDGVIDVCFEEAISSTIAIARSEGVLIGLSSGAVVSAFKKAAREQGLENGDYVLVFPDNGFKYIEYFHKYLNDEKE